MLGQAPLVLVHRWVVHVVLPLWLAVLLGLVMLLRLRLLLLRL